MPLIFVPSSDITTRGSRRMLSSLRRGPSEANTISSSSSPTHTQLTCGLPSSLTVTRCASASLSRMTRASSGIVVTGESYGPLPVQHRPAGAPPADQRTSRGRRLAARGVLAAALLASTVIGLDVLLELRVGGAERVGAVAARLDHVE